MSMIMPSAPACVFSSNPELVALIRTLADEVTAMKEDIAFLRRQAENHGNVALSQGGQEPR